MGTQPPGGVVTTLTIDWLGRPPLANAMNKLTHHPRAAIRRRWRDAGHAAALEARIPPHHAITVTVQARYRTRQLCDVCAIEPAVKAVIDGLVDAQVIPDDTPTYVHRVTFLAPYTEQGSPDALIVTIEEAGTP